jgi:hypothetical protein
LRGCSYKSHIICPQRAARRLRSLPNCCIGTSSIAAAIPHSLEMPAFFTEELRRAGRMTRDHSGRALAAIVDPQNLYGSGAGS